MRTLLGLFALLIVGHSDGRAEDQFLMLRRLVYSHWTPPANAQVVKGELAINASGQVVSYKFTNQVDPQTQQSLLAAISQSQPLTMFASDAADSIDGVVRVGIDFDPKSARGKPSISQGGTNPGSSNPRSGQNGNLAQVQPSSSSASADIGAVRQCLASFYNECQASVAITNVQQIDRRIAATDATVIVEIKLQVRQSFAGSSRVALNCTGTGWDMDPAKVRSMSPNMGVPLPGSENSFLIGQNLRIRKHFEFQKYESGWRCATKSLQPVEAGFYDSQ